MEILDLATAPTEAILDRYEAVRFQHTAERRALQNEIGWRVRQARRTRPIIRGSIQYTLDANDELCRVRVSPQWVKETTQCDLDVSWYEHAKYQRASARNKERRQTKVAS